MPLVPPGDVDDGTMAAALLAKAGAITRLVADEASMLTRPATCRLGTAPRRGSPNHQPQGVDP